MMRSNKHTLAYMVLMLDLQKIALDKLSERIHDIWGKMEDAAKVSIEFNTAQSQAANRRPESK